MDASISKLTVLGLTPQSEPPPGFDPQNVAPRYTGGDKALPLLSVALDVSGRCNLACRYCAEAATQPDRESMTVDVMKAAVRLLEMNPAIGIRPSLRIGSGEPLLALPLLRQLHAFLAESAVPIDVSVTTNGTLINDEVADWFASTGWRIKISLDGPASIHDALRPRRGGRPSYQDVVKAVHSMVERCPERVSVAAVLCHDSDPAVVFKTIADLGVRRIELLPVAYQPIQGNQDIQLTLDDIYAYNDFVNDYARSVAADGLEVHPALVRFEETMHFLMGYGNPAVPCGAGRSFVGVGPTGAIYPCFRFVGVNDYCIGDLEQGLDDVAVTAFRDGPGRTTEHRPECSTCWAAPLCGGPCYSVAEFFGPGNGAPVKLHCAYKLADCRAAFWLVNHLREHDIERLLSFLPIMVDIP